MIVVICDDQADIVSFLAAKVEELCREKDIEAQIIKYQSGEQLVRDIFAEGSALLTPESVFLLDIDMPEPTGFDIARMIRSHINKANIIFVSSRDELVFNSLEYAPFYFVRKTHLDELDSQFMRLYKYMTPIVLNLSPAGSMKLRADEVVYVESALNYLNVFREQDTAATAIKTRMKMSEAETRWGALGFVRIHKSFFVNVAHISAIRPDTIMLKNGGSLPIGRKYIKTIRASIMEVANG